MSAQGGGWFGPKRWGWGIIPKTWQGWVTTAVYAALMIGLSRVVSPRTEHLEFVGAIVVLTAAFLAICIWKSERTGSRSLRQCQWLIQASAFPDRHEIAGREKNEPSLVRPEPTDGQANACRPASLVVPTNRQALLNRAFFHACFWNGATSSASADSGSAERLFWLTRCSPLVPIKWPVSTLRRQWRLSTIGKLSNAKNQQPAERVDGRLQRFVRPSNTPIANHDQESSWALCGALEKTYLDPTGIDNLEVEMAVVSNT